MDATENQLNSFFVKFRDLWKAGHTAHLDLDAKNGKAWVGIRLELGCNESSINAHPFTSARERRREKRAAARNNSHVKMSEKFVAETESDMDLSSPPNVNEDPTEQVAKVDSMDLEILEKLDSSVVQEENSIKDNGIEHVADEALNKKSTEESKEVHTGGAAEVASDYQNVDENVSIVHATIVLNESPHAQVCKTDLKSIAEIIDNKEHMRRNIIQVQFGKMQNTEDQNKLYRHEIQTILKVKISQLWENARTYLWKHLGTSSWSIGNGTKVSFTRIHVK